LSWCPDSIEIPTKGGNCIKPKKTSISLTLIAGRLLYSKKSNKENYLFEGKIDIQGLQSGIYVISINVNGETKYQKFVIE